MKQYLKAQGFKKYLSNMSYLATERVLRLLLSFFVGVYVARYLGPDHFGLFSYGTSIIFILGTLSSFGIDDILIKDLVSMDLEKQKELIGTAFILRLFSSVLSLLILYLILYFTNKDTQTITLIMTMGSSLLLWPFYSIDCLFQAHVLSRYTVYVQIIQQIISAILKIYFIQTNKPLIYFAIVMLVDTIVISSGFIIIYIVRFKQKVRHWRFNWSSAKHLIIKSFPLLLSGVTASLYLKIDQIMIKELLGNNASGNYAVAIRLSETWYFIPYIIVGTLFPAIIKSKEGSSEHYRNRIQHLYNLMVSLGVCIAIPVSLLSPWIIRLLFGESYHQASGPLSIHVWGGLFAAIGIASAKSYIADNLQMFLFYRSAFGAIINILLNFILIKHSGIVGAASATLITQILTNYIFDIFFKETRSSFMAKSKALSFLFIKDIIKGKK